jgi:hypothetical protein
LFVGRQVADGEIQDDKASRLVVNGNPA